MRNSDQLTTVGEVMATDKWVDKPPVNGESYERFFIKDKETHEWIFGMSRESFAKYVCGIRVEGNVCPNPKFEPLRDEIHHLIVGSLGYVYFDSIEYQPGYIGPLNSPV